MRVYNTLNRTKEDFVPLEGNVVKMYVCGPTVYDYPHIGNARSFVVFDTIRRYLEYRGYRVRYVTNFTDIDDKMIARAQEEGMTVAELARRFIHEYMVITQQLNIRPATLNPRATEHIEEMIEMIRKIVENGKAYVVDGDVYFDVSETPGYGRLSRVTLEELEAGARVEPGEKKRDPKDFALWKAQKPGEPAWDSPWGKGRPGWHIECSVMGARHLGIPFDIHGGGQDLIFPHHENELAQTVAAYGVEMPVKYWLHNGFLTINMTKMSKSEGNFLTARQVLDKHDPQSVRLFLVSAHYRQPLDYSSDSLAQAEQSVQRIRNAIEVINGRLSILERGPVPHSDADDLLAESVKRAVSDFEREMDDDFNTPGALAALFSLVKAINTYAPEVSRALVLRETLSALHDLLSVLGLDVSQTGSGTTPNINAEIIDGLVEMLLELRERARKSKDFSTADQIRSRLASLGIVVTDTKDGPTWKIEREGELSSQPPPQG
ncbi:MAG: cysteine--tRNA ligase [Candidatus Thorarchaeota archaeon]